MSWQWRRKTPAPRAKSDHKRKLEEMKINELEKILDREFSFYVRTRAMNEQGMVKCISCGSWNWWNDVDAGHYINRRNRGVRWSTINVQPQCRFCNRFSEGEQAKFRKALVEKYGEGKVVDLEEYAAFFGNTRIPREMLIEEIKKYRKLNAAMRKKTRDIE